MVIRGSSLCSFVFPTTGIGQRTRLGESEDSDRAAQRRDFETVRTLEMMEFVAAKLVLRRVEKQVWEMEGW